MPGIADYTTRTEGLAIADLADQFRTVARTLSALGYDVDAWLREAETAQVEETNRRAAASLEELIQKLGAISRDVWELHRKIRKIGVEGATRAIEAETAIVARYAPPEEPPE